MDGLHFEHTHPSIQRVHIHSGLERASFILLWPPTNHHTFVNLSRPTMLLLCNDDHGLVMAMNADREKSENNAHFAHMP